MLAARVEQKNGMTKDDKNGVMPLDKESPIQAGCGKSACPDRRGLAETVADLGHVPRVTASGREGLTLLTANDIDCVLLDLRMPGGIDGIEVLRRIRERDDAPPGIVLTAFATAENTIEAMRLGAFSSDKTDRSPGTRCASEAAAPARHSAGGGRGQRDRHAHRLERSDAPRAENDRSRGRQ
jgi:CheY-like chemotaxis protein